MEVRRIRCPRAKRRERGRTKEMELDGRRGRDAEEDKEKADWLTNNLMK